MATKINKEYLTYYIDFLRAMTVKEIKARYKKAVLGFLWVILNPLLQMLVIGFVFQFFVPVKVGNYFLFLFTGLLPWNFFSGTVTKNTPMMVNERSLISKAKFPRESIVLALVLSNMFHLIISLGLLMVLLIGDKLILERYSWLKLIEYIARMVWTGPILVWLCLLTSGLSLLFTAWNVKYRDVNFVVQAVMPLWFYATPVIYTLDLLPKQLRVIAYLNPMTSIVELMHWSLLGIEITSVRAIGLSVAVSMVAVGLGWKVFVRESPMFDDWV